MPADNIQPIPNPQNLSPAECDAFGHAQLFWALIAGGNDALLRLLVVQTEVVLSVHWGQLPELSRRRLGGWIGDEQLTCWEWESLSGQERAWVVGKVRRLAERAEARRAMVLEQAA